MNRIQQFLYRRKIKKAADKIVDAQLLFAEIQSKEIEKNNLYFWADRVGECMDLYSKILKHEKDWMMKK